MSRETSNSTCCNEYGKVRYNWRNRSTLGVWQRTRTTDDVQHNIHAVIHNDNCVPEITPEITKEIKEKVEAKQDLKKKYADRMK